MIKILIVDDDDSLRALLANRMATAYSMEVVQASSANAAIKLLESGERFSVIVSDFNMPDGDGADLQRFLVRSDCRSLFFFFTSEKDVPNDPNHRYFVGTIQKPHLNKLINEAVMSICMFPHILNKDRLP